MTRYPFARERVRLARSWIETKRWRMVRREIEHATKNLALVGQEFTLAREPREVSPDGALLPSFDD